MGDADITNIPIAIVKPHGLYPVTYTAISLVDAADKEPLGVYTVGRTYDRTKVLLWTEHLDRLEQSANLEFIPAQIDRQTLRQGLRTLIERSGLDNVRYRITIPRQPPRDPIITIEPFRGVPTTILRQGVQVMTIPVQRHNPLAKTSDWMTARKKAVAIFPTDVYEAVLVNATGQLLEGATSNFYGVIHGELFTADKGILEGIARRVLLKVAPDILPVTLTAPRLHEPLDEAFLTSASRGVVPIIGIDGKPIADGLRGAFTERLQDAYNAWVQAHLEEL